MAKITHERFQRDSIIIILIKKKFNSNYFLVVGVEITPVSMVADRSTPAPVSLDATCEQQREKISFFVNMGHHGLFFSFSSDVPIRRLVSPPTIPKETQRELNYSIDEEQ